MVACNVAEVIFLELDSDGLTFRNPLYNSILATYREQWKILGTGVEVPAHFFLNHPDPEVCNASVDILASDVYKRQTITWPASCGGARTSMSRAMPRCWP